MFMNHLREFFPPRFFQYKAIRLEEQFCCVWLWLLKLFCNTGAQRQRVHFITDQQHIYLFLQIHIAIYIRLTIPPKQLMVALRIRITSNTFFIFMVSKESCATFHAWRGSFRSNKRNSRPLPNIRDSYNITLLGSGFSCKLWDWYIVISSKQVSCICVTGEKFAIVMSDL